MFSAFPPARRIACWAALTAICAFAPAAHAAAPDEWQLGVGAGASVLWAQDAFASAGLLNLDVQRGLNDAWAWRIAMEGAWQARQGVQDRSVRAANASAGITYSLDVLRIVPFAELSLCSLWQARALSDSVDLGLQAGVGADYLLGPHYSVAVMARYAYLPGRVSDSAGPGGAPQLATLSVRFSYRVF